MVAGVVRRHANGRGVGPVDLVLPPAGLVALVGPSGCGKSTLLRCLAGLDATEDGSIVVEGRDVDRIPAGRRSVGLLEQHLPLYDHLDARENVRMAVSGLRLPRAEREQRVEEALDATDASELATTLASKLSGGERARICLARLLARRPAVALLDEPFSGLDRTLHDRVRTASLDALRDAGVGTLLVTHDDRDLDRPHDRLELDSDGRMID